MSALFHEFRNGGWPNFLILLLGLFGFGLGVAAAVVAAFRSRAGRVLGAVAAGLAIVILGTGALGVMFGHRATDRALAGAGISAVQSERIQREGYLESKSCAEFGLGAALFPLLGGAIALLASRRQGLALPGAMLGIAALVAAGDAALVAQKLPGHDYPIDDPVWSMLEAKEDIDGGQVRQGCERLESSLGARSADGTAVGDPSRLPDFERLAGVCMDARIDAALEDGPGALGELLTGTKPEMLDEAHRKRIHDELAKLEPLKIAHDGSDVTGLAMLPGMGATAPDARVRIRAHGVSVNGRLPPEVVQRIVQQSFARFRLCYDMGAQTNPKLEGDVQVRFVIGRTGDVSTVADGGSTLADARVVTCIERQFDQLSFPAPEGGIVTVLYPMTFTPVGH
jgi:hypothetical protein